MVGDIRSDILPSHFISDPDAVREEKIVKKINEIINNPPQLEDYDNGEDDGEGYEQDQADMLDLSPAYADEELVDANLAQFLRMNGVVGGGGGEATSSPVAPALNPPQQQLKDQLRKILANFTGAASAPTAGHNSDGSGYGGSSSTAAEKEFELTSVITGESIKSVMNDPAAVEGKSLSAEGAHLNLMMQSHSIKSFFSALFSYLPEDCPKTKAEMEVRLEET